MSFTFEVHKRGVDLQVAAKHVPKRFRAFVAETAGSYAYDTMVKRAPYRTGKLRLSIRKQVRGVDVIVSPTVPYAIFVEGGTAPHFILPRDASVLRFDVAGDVVFAQWVLHPGTKPQPFVRESVAETRRMLPLMFRKLTETIWTG